MSHRLFLLFVFALGLLVIASAWGFEILGGYRPCGLCLQQRLPYYAGVPLAAAGFFLAARGAPERLTRLFLVLLALIFAASLALAIRHAGVEWGWWLGPSNCGAGDLSGFGDGKSLLEALQNAKIVYCDKAAARFLGLSFAGWNAVSSLVLMAAAVRGALTRISLS